MSKISEMPSATSVSGSDYVEVLQSGVNKKALVSLLALSGPAGIDGQSAYEVAVSQGFSGTISEWLNSLHGATGNVGPTGPQGQTGPQGIKGDTGAAGPTGPQGLIGPIGPTGPQGLQGVRGDTGVAGPQGIQGLQGLTGPMGPQGPVGPQGPTGQSGVNGVNGRSAYQLAVDLGFVGDEATWILSIKGDKGDQGAPGLNGGADGRSAYEIAVDNGFVGTVEQWLVSLIGQTGPQGLKGDTGDTGPQGIQGIQGPIGLTGPKGDTGAAGAAGANGLTGPKGDTGAAGAAGKSAYQSAVENGFVGTEAEWIQSMVTETELTNALASKVNSNNPVFSGVAEIPGSVVVDTAAMVGNVIDSTKAYNTITINSDVTLSISPTPASNTWFQAEITNNSSTARKVTIPSCLDMMTGENITSFVVPANFIALATFRYTGTNYQITVGPGPAIYGVSREITGAATLGETDVNTTLRFNSATTAVLTIPDDTTLGITGSKLGNCQIIVYVKGTAVPTFAADTAAGVSIQNTPVAGLARYSTIVLNHTGDANTWSYA